MNVEFADELQGCKKPMSRDLTGLMTHENTGVAGYSAAAVVDARELKVQQSICPCVELWSRRSRFKFPLLHCIVHVSLERGREAPTVTVTMPVVSLDEFSLSLSDSTTGEGNTPTLVHPT